MFQSLKMSETETVLLRVRAAKQPPDKRGNHMPILGKENLPYGHQKKVTFQQNQCCPGTDTKKLRRPFSILNSTNPLTTAVQLCTTFGNDTQPGNSPNKVTFIKQL